MENEISPDLLKKYLRGETTLEESILVDKWYLFLEENPGDPRLLDPVEDKKTEKKILERIKSDIAFKEGKTQKERSSNLINPYFRSSLKWAAAISALAVIGIGYLLLFNKEQSFIRKNEGTASVIPLKKITNDSRFVTRHFLEDGSVINLQPNSSIELPETFALTSREILLTGEAFFEIEKDKNRPFIITTGNNVTVKVLGTSFSVKAYQGAREITIAVKTGKVSVYAKASTPSILKNEATEEIILTPNHEVVYNTAEENFSKKLVEKPEIILTKPLLFEMKYDAMSVVKILAALEENYGIDIIYDHVALSGCLLTTSMAEEGLYERIEIICKAINAQYKLEDDKILITSNGCL